MTALFKLVGPPTIKQIPAMVSCAIDLHVRHLMKDYDFRNTFDGTSLRCVAVTVILKSRERKDFLTINSFFRDWGYSLSPNE